MATPSRSITGPAKTISGRRSAAPAVQGLHTAASTHHSHKAPHPASGTASDADTAKRRPSRASGTSASEHTSASAVTSTGEAAPSGVDFTAPA